MKFNIDKTNFMSISRNKNIIDYQYTIDNKCILRVSSFCDLGLEINTKLNWNDHIKKCCGKANKKLGFIKRKLGFNSPVEVKRLCYTALVRPLLEYGTLIWNHYNKSSLTLLESIQRRATKFILRDYTLDYKLRLQKCDLLPLSLRRDLLDIVYTYDCINDKIDFNVFNYLEEYNIINNTRSQDTNVIRFKISVPKLESSRHYFRFRLPAIWNNIPSDILEIEPSASGDNKCFKKHLKLWLFDKLNNFDSNVTCTWIVKSRCSRCRLV